VTFSALLVWPIVLSHPTVAGASEESLYAFFAECGEVEAVRIVRDKVRCSGFQAASLLPSLKRLP
jgi:hypothetical protein